MSEYKSLTFVEIDVDYCSHEYGVSPCTASISGSPSTGNKKCFNTRATCQDRANFNNEPVTLRFAIDTAYLHESGIDAIACIDNISFSPAKISLGGDLGQRASVSVRFSDFRWSDTGEGYDKYVDERSYDPFEQGTYWGKFRARQPYLRGRALRLIRGYLGQSLSEMETRHYLMEDFDGPSLGGKYTITAKDPLKLLDGDRAQAPIANDGFLTSDLNDSATSFTLSPAGIGDAEYDSYGYIAIGGKEICAFIRTGDLMEITRAQYNTPADDHSAGDRVQQCIEYSGEDAADIISDLMQTYGDVDSDYIDIDAWRLETENFLRRQYSALIAEPTSVRTLISELIEQAALCIWWDDLNQLVRLQVLRQISTEAATIDASVYRENTFIPKEQPGKRISQVWTYFAQINPLKKVDDTDNYRSIAATIETDAETDYGQPAIKKIYSRWIPAGGRQVASRVNDLQLGRFRDPPRAFRFDVFRLASVTPVIGIGYQLMSSVLQTDEGEADSVPIQVTRLNPEADYMEVQAEELQFTTFDYVDLSNRLITYDSYINNVNLRTTHDLLYPEPESGDEITCVIEDYVIIGSNSTSEPAFDVGSWPSGVIVNVIVKGRIQGAGGQGGSGPQHGGAGGVALYTRENINLELENGEIWGGGGGGGGYIGGAFTNGGGGGAGQNPGSGGGGHKAPGGTAGTTEAGGIGGGGAGNGGDPGQSGQNSSSNGGSAGSAIDGVSYVTETGTGDIRGSEVN